MALVSGRKPAGKAAVDGDSSNDDPEVVGAKNEDSINRVLHIGNGARVIMAKRRMIVVDIFSLIEQLTDLLSPSTDYVSGTGTRPRWWYNPLRRQRWLLHYFLREINHLCLARAREPGLAFLPAEDEYAEVLRGEHHTTVSKWISLVVLLFTIYFDIVILFSYRRLCLLQ